MSIKQWFLLLATLAFPLSAQTAAGSGEESLMPVSVEVFQSRVEQQGSQNEVNESFTWWVTVDKVDKTATIVAPPTAGKYQFDFAGWQSANAIAEYGMYLWNPTIAGLPGESFYFSAVRLPEKVTIDDTDYTVTAIGERAFAESNVAYLHVPSSVMSIGDYAFQDATSLVGIDVASGYELVPNSVTELGRGAFKGCTALKRIDIGDGVAELKEETFDGCTSLTQISLGLAVKKISCKLSGELAFHSSTAPEFTHADILKAVTTVWYPKEFSLEYTTAFSGVALSPFSIESTYGPELRFYKDRSRTISFEITSAQWLPTGNNTLYYFLYPSVAAITGDEQIEAQTELSDGMTILTAPTNDVAVPVTHVPFRLLFDDNTVVSIADFNDGSQATESSVTLRYTIEGHYRLTVMANDLTRASRTWNIEVVDGLMPTRVEISGKTYMAVNSEQTLTAKVLGTDGSAAYDQNISWSVSDETVATIDAAGKLTTLKEGEVTVTATSTDPGSDSVEATLTVYVVETIKEEITVVEVAQTHRSSQENSAAVTEKFSWWVSKDDLNKTATIIAPQTTDGKYHFNYPGLASECSPTAASIDLWSPSLAGFYGEDTHFTAVRMPATVEIEGEEYTVTAIGERAFAESNIAYIHIPSTVETIGDYAFENATSLAGIGVASAYELVPNSVTSLGRGAFKGCTSLTRIDIGDGVTEIKEETFDGCTALKQISIGSSVAKISCALEGLDAVSFHSEEAPTIDETGSVSASVIWVPEESLSAYTTAFSGSTIEAFSVTPAQQKLKFYKDYPHEIQFEVKSAPWIPEGDNTLYYFIYEALRFNQVNEASKANAILVGKATEDSDGEFTHVPYRLYFSDNTAVTINDVYTLPRATNTSVYLRYDKVGTYQLTLVSNDVARATYTWDVEVVEGVPVDYIAISGPSAVEVNEEAQFTVTVNGSGGQEASWTEVTWSVSDESIATIDETGKLTAIAEGEVTVYATSTDLATPELRYGFILNVNEGGTLMFPHTQTVAGNRSITNASSGSWATVIEPKEVTTELWYYPNDDGTFTLTYPNAKKSDATDDKAKNPYRFEFLGDTSIVYGQQQIMYGAGMESFSLLKGNEGAGGFMTAFDMPTLIKRSLDINPNIPYVDMKPVSKIGEYAFANSNITVLNIGEINAKQAAGESLTEIGDFAFYNCVNFLGVPEGTAYEVVPDHVTKLGRNVFDGCRNMQRMIIGNGVEEIPTMAFHDCMSLQELYLGKNVKRIKCDIFAHRRLVFASPEPPEIISDEVQLRVISPEVWVPEGAKEAYVEAGYDESTIYTYSFEINEGEDIYACVNTKRKAYLTLNNAPLSTKSAQPYLYAYPSGESGQWMVNHNQPHENRPRYEVVAKGVYHIFPYSNRFEVKYTPPGTYQIKFRSLDITNQIVTATVHVADMKPITHMNIIGPAGARLNSQDSFDFKVRITKNDEASTPPMLKWTSSNPDIVEIDETTGNAKAKSYGSVVITATTNNPYFEQVTAKINIDVRREGTASTWIGAQRHPAVNSVSPVATSIPSEVTQIEWWYHLSETPGAQSGPQSAAISFPLSTVLDQALLANGKLVNENCYNFGWTGWEGFYQSGYGAFAWHKGMPKDLTPNYFTAIEVPENVYFGETPIPVTALAPGAFAGSNATIVHVHDGVESIGDYAFAYCPNLIGLSLSGDYEYIPSSVKSIGKGLFKDSPNVRYMNIGDGVTIVPEETFDGCEKLTWVGFGKNVKRINCNIAASKYEGTGENRKLKFDALKYVAFRSPEPPEIPSNLVFKTEMIYVPKGSAQAYREAWSGRFAGIISEYSITFAESEINCYVKQDTKIYFTKRTAISGATTFYFMYPCDHRQSETDIRNLYGFTVNARSNAGAHGAWFIMDFEDADGNKLDHETIWAANRVCDEFATITFAKPGTYKFYIEAFDGTRCRESVTVNVSAGNPVESIIVNGYSGVNIGSEIQLTATVLGPPDPNNYQKRLEPSIGGVTWASSNKAVATVDQNGKVTGVSEGYAMIVAISKDPLCSNVLGSKRIYVGDKFTDMAIYRKDITTSERVQQFEYPYGIFGYPGEMFRLEAEGYPYGIGGESEFIWEMTTPAGTKDIFTFASSDNLIRLLEPGHSTLKVTIPAHLAQGGEPIEFEWPVIVKTPMKEIEVTKPVNPSDDDDNPGGGENPGGGDTPGGDNDDNDPIEPQEPITDDSPLDGLNGDEVEVNVNIDPDATNRYVDFESSDPDIVDVVSVTRNDATEPAALAASATVRTPDCKATLILKKKGHATVTALDPDRRGAKYSFPVEVRQRAESIRLFNPESGEEISERRMIASHPRVAISPRAEILPLNANINDLPSSQRVSYKSVDSGKITDNGDGTLTVNETGFIEAIATVADGSKTEVRFTIHSTALAVEELVLATDVDELKVGETATVAAKFMPTNATDQRLLWSTSNRAVLTVSEGVVTAVAPGTATITATSLSNKTIFATMSITVVAPDEPENPDNPGGDDPENPGGDDPENPGDDQPDDPDGPTTAIDYVAVDQIRVATEGDMIIISGAPAGMTVRVYNISGSLIHQSQSEGNELRIAVKTRGVYIVIAGKVYKISV